MRGYRATMSGSCTTLRKICRSLLKKCLFFFLGFCFNTAFLASCKWNLYPKHPAAVCYEVLEKVKAKAQIVMDAYLAKSSTLSYLAVVLLFGVHCKGFMVPPEFFLVPDFIKPRFRHNHVFLSSKLMLQSYCTPNPTLCALDTEPYILSIEARSLSTKPQIPKPRMVAPQHEVPVSAPNNDILCGAHPANPSIHHAYIV